MKKAKVLAAGLLLGMLTRGVVPVLAAEDTVMQGVWLGAVEISGMTEAEVEAEARKQEEKALQQGRQGNLVHRYRKQQELKGDGHTLRLGYSVDPEKVKTALEEKCVPYNEESVDSQLVKKEDGSFEIISGSAGSEIDVEASVEAVQEYISNEWNGLEDGRVELVMNTVEGQSDPEELGKVQDVLGEA